MKVTKEDSRPREVTLTIEVDAAEVEPYLQRAYRKVVQKVNIPGFRRGKAPRSLVERYLGREALMREAIEFMVPETVSKAVKQESIEAYDSPTMELETVEPLKIKAVVPLAPHVDLGDYKALRMEPVPEPITEEAVDRVIEEIRRNQAPWQPVERPVKFGDRLTIDLEGSVDGRQVANDKKATFIPELSNFIPVPGFSVQLEGMAKGETKEFSLPIPADSPDASMAGKDILFKATVHEIKEKLLPELDDEFAKSLGNEHGSLEELRDSVRKGLQAEMERQARVKMRDEAFATVMKNATLELPEMIVQRDVDELLHEQAHQVNSKHMSHEEYLQMVGKTDEEVRAEFLPKSQERLRRNILLARLAKAEGITVTDDDVDADLAVMEKGQGGQSLARALSTDSGRRSLAGIILTRKVLERLEAIVTGKGDEPQTSETPAGEAESASTEVKAP